MLLVFFFIIVQFFCFLGVEVLLGLPVSSSFDFLLFRSPLPILDVKGFSSGICSASQPLSKLEQLGFLELSSKNIRFNTENKVVIKPALSYQIGCMSPHHTYMQFKDTVLKRLLADYDSLCWLQLLLPLGKCLDGPSNCIANSINVQQWWILA